MQSPTPKEKLHFNQVSLATLNLLKSRQLLPKQDKYVHASKQKGSKLHTQSCPAGRRYSKPLVKLTKPLFKKKKAVKEWGQGIT